MEPNENEHENEKSPGSYFKIKKQKIDSEWQPFFV